MTVSKDYWSARYLSGQGSGYGSSGEQSDKKLKWLSTLTDVHSVTDVGCGDFSFGKWVMELFPDAKYIGLDIAEVVIRRNTAMYERYGYQFKFMQTPIPPADLVLCIDVFLHILNDDEFERMQVELEKAWTKYLVITAYERDEEYRGHHVRIKKFDYKRFGEPILREVVEEDGKMMFYIWKK